MKSLTKNTTLNQYILQCQMCSTITKTPKNATFGDILECSDCGCNLANCEKLYDYFKNSDLIWKIWEYEIEDDAGNIKIIKAKELDF